MKNAYRVFGVFFAALIAMNTVACGDGGGQSQSESTETHNYVAEKVVEPTCTKDGYTVFACTECGKKYSGAVTEKLGHDFISHDAKSATCATFGYGEWRTCSRCAYNDYSTKIVEKNGHVYDENDECEICGFTHIKTLGSYPKSAVTDETVAESLNAYIGILPTKDDPAEWISYKYYLSGVVSDYMWYKDVEFGDERYRGIYFTSYRSKDVKGNGFAETSYQDEYGYYTGEVYWFKFEPLKWLAIDDDGDTGKILLWCTDIIDCHEYQSECVMTNPFYTLGVNSSVIASSYAQSNVRQWLNSAFYETAFSSEDKEKILLTTVDNSGKTTSNDGNRAASKNTNDNVFLLSYKDMFNDKYGFKKIEDVDGAFWGNSDVAKQKKVTEYAKSQGAWSGFLKDDDREGNMLEEYSQNGIWLLRSPRQVDIMNLSSAGEQVLGYNADGTGRSEVVYFTSNGIVPAIYVDRNKI